MLLSMYVSVWKSGRSSRECFTISCLTTENNCFQKPYCSHTLLRWTRVLHSNARSERCLGDFSLPSCFFKTLKGLALQKYVCQIPAIIGFGYTAAIYCNSMEAFMKRNRFFTGKLYFSTSVRNKEMKQVNKHIGVNSNKQKGKPFNSLKYFS